VLSNKTCQDQNNLSCFWLCIIDLSTIIFYSKLVFIFLSSSLKEVLNNIKIRQIETMKLQNEAKKAENDK